MADIMQAAAQAELDLAFGGGILDPSLVTGGSSPHTSDGTYVTLTFLSKHGMSVLAGDTVKPNIYVGGTGTGEAEWTWDGKTGANTWYFQTVYDTPTAYTLRYAPTTPPTSGTHPSVIGTVCRVLYVGLYTATPSNGTGGTELPLSTNGYARVPVANDLSAWTPAVTGTAPAAATKVNASIITFNTATVAGWSGVLGWGTWGSATGTATNGLLGPLYWGGLASTINVAAGQTKIFPVGGLTITRQ